MGAPAEAIILLNGDARQGRDRRKRLAATPAVVHSSWLGLRGDIDEPKEALAESLKIKPGLNTLAGLRGFTQGGFSNPKFLALAAKTYDIGLRRTGLPGE
jgi:hypothetical protein